MSKSPISDQVRWVVGAKDAYGLISRKPNADFHTTEAVNYLKEMGVEVYELPDSAKELVAKG